MTEERWVIKDIEHNVVTPSNIDARDLKAITRVENRIYLFFHTGANEDLVYVYEEIDGEYQFTLVSDANVHEYFYLPVKESVVDGTMSVKETANELTECYSRSVLTKTRERLDLDVEDGQEVVVTIGQETYNMVWHKDSISYVLATPIGNDTFDFVQFARNGVGVAKKGDNYFYTVDASNWYNLAWIDNLLDFQISQDGRFACGIKIQGNNPGIYFISLLATEIDGSKKYPVWTRIYTLSNLTWTSGHYFGPQISAVSFDRWVAIYQESPSMDTNYYICSGQGTNSSGTVITGCYTFSRGSASGTTYLPYMGRVYATDKTKDGKYVDILMYNWYYDEYMALFTMSGNTLTPLKSGDILPKANAGTTPPSGALKICDNTFAIGYGLSSYYDKFNLHPVLLQEGDGFVVHLVYPEYHSLYYARIFFTSSPIVEKYGFTCDTYLTGEQARSIWLTVLDQNSLKGVVITRDFIIRIDRANGSVLDAVKVDWHIEVPAKLYDNNRKDLSILLFSDQACIYIANGQFHINPWKYAIQVNSYVKDYKKVWTGIYPLHSVETNNTQYWANGNTIYIESRRWSPTNKPLLYFEELNTGIRPNHITNLLVVEQGVVALFHEYEVWYVTPGQLESGAIFYNYYKSRIGLGMREGADVQVMYDGATICYATPRGIVGMNYQQLTQNTDQILTFLSDSISQKYQEWYEAGDGKVKIFNYKYWTVFYQEGNWECLLLDLRTGTWWVWNSLLDNPLQKLFLWNHKPLILVDNGRLREFEMDNSAYYKDMNLATIEWFVTSQPLHFNALNNFKRIANISLNAIETTQEPFSYVLITRNFKERKNITGPELVLFDEDKVQVGNYRTYVKRLNYIQSVKFQYTVTNNEQALRPTPVNLTAMTVKYEIKGRIR